jgi:short-subunit dehydrogenase
MQITQSVALVTGANRGIGRALVEALVAGGATKVYAAGRDRTALDALAASAPGRIVPLTLDVTDADAVARLGSIATDVNLLINNAGVLDFGSPLDMPIAAIERNFAVNFYGPIRTTRALAPVIAGNGGGAVVNIASIVSLASMPSLSGYAASKAALWSFGQALRAELAAKVIAFHSVFPGPVDTDMAAEIPMQKTSPAEVARAILAGVVEGREDIFPDPMSASVGAAWAQDHKAVEKQFAA